jgi:hypothetical protein
LIADGFAAKGNTPSIPIWGSSTAESGFHSNKISN